MSIARMMQMAAAGQGGGGWVDPDLANASYDGVSFVFSSQETDPQGLAFSSDGTKMYITGDDSDSVYQYSLSTAFDLSTASYDSVSFSVLSQDNQTKGIAFNSDGTKMYTTGDTNDSVFQYSLSTGFDLSTASYDSVSFSVSSQIGLYISGLAFSVDGSKMYVISDSNDSVYQYSLSTSFDLSTASYDSTSFSFSSQDISPRAVFFNTDGTKMYMLGDSNDNVSQYSLSTNFDLSGASYDNVNFSVSSQITYTRGLYFNGNGSKMYVAGVESGNHTVFQYSTA